MSGTDIWKKVICCPDPKNIFDTENDYSHIFHNCKEGRVCGELVEGLHKCDNDIADNCDCNKEIKSPADAVAFVSNLNDIKYFLFHKCVLIYFIMLGNMHIKASRGYQNVILNDILIIITWWYL